MAYVWRDYPLSPCILTGSVTDFSLRWDDVTIGWVWDTSDKGTSDVGNWANRTAGGITANFYKDGSGDGAGGLWDKTPMGSWARKFRERGDMPNRRYNYQVDRSTLVANEFYYWRFFVTLNEVVTWAGLGSWRQLQYGEIGYTGVYDINISDQETPTEEDEKFLKVADENPSIREEDPKPSLDARYVRADGNVDQYTGFKARFGSAEKSRTDENGGSIFDQISYSSK